MNKKSRKVKLVLDATINDGENESEINEIQDISVEGESGCKSPAKKSSKKTKKWLVNKENWICNKNEKLRATGESYQIK